MATTLANPSNGNLSGGNLTFTGTGGSNSAMSSRTITGPTYGEVSIGAIGTVLSIGIVASAYDSSQMGANGLSCGYLSSGAVKYNGTTLATLSTFTTGDRVGWAVDPLNRLIWFRVNGGNWNGSALNNPATGVGGLSFAVTSQASAQLATMLFGAQNTGLGTWTAKFSTPFTDTAPAGFSSMDVQQITRAWSQDAVGGAPVVALSTTAAARCAQMPSGDRAKMAFSPAATITYVSGTTKEAGVIVIGKRVDVYDRTTGDLLGCTVSDGSGNWSVACMGRPAVRVVGSDPTTYNSIVFDNVVPV